MNELTWAQIAQLCSFSIMMAAGQVLFKLAAAHAPVLNTFSSLLNTFSPFGVDKFFSLSIYCK
jgi:hypothetical protein